MLEGRRKFAYDIVLASAMMLMVDFAEPLMLVTKAASTSRLQEAVLPGGPDQMVTNGQMFWIRSTELAARLCSR
jgi:hypothetical protein